MCKVEVEVVKRKEERREAPSFPFSSSFFLGGQIDQFKRLQGNRSRSGKGD